MDRHTPGRKDRIVSRHTTLGPLATQVARHEMVALCGCGVLWPTWVPDGRRAECTSSEIIEWQGTRGYLLYYHHARTGRAVSILGGPWDPFVKMADCHESPAVYTFGPTWVAGSDGCGGVRLEYAGLTVYVHVTGWPVAVALTVAERLVLL